MRDCSTCKQPMPTEAVQQGDIVMWRFYGVLCAVTGTPKRDAFYPTAYLCVLTGPRKGEGMTVGLHALDVVHGHFHIDSRRQAV